MNENSGLGPDVRCLSTLRTDSDNQVSLGLSASAWM
jgi:hypothetical protein